MAQERITKKYLIGDIFAFELAQEATVALGNMVMLEAGKANNATKKTGVHIAGIARATAVHGAAGVTKVEVDKGVFAMENDGKISSADIGKDAYVKDAITVTTTSTGSSKAGIIMQVDDYVWVKFG